MKYLTRALLVLLSIVVFASGALAQQTKEEKNEALCGEMEAKIKRAEAAGPNAYACLQIGDRYRILDRDFKKALVYYIKACDGGDLEGCTNGGVVLLMKGTPYSKQFKQSRKMLDKSCKAGEDRACFNLGTLNYKEGRQSKAIKYYKKACEMGNQAGCAKEKRLKR